MLLPEGRLFGMFIASTARSGEPNYPVIIRSYLFSQPSGGAPEYGVSHASEIAYVFGGLKSDATTGDKDVSNKMMQYWWAFPSYRHIDSKHNHERFQDKLCDSIRSPPR
jgi:carboxylesterase type B